MRVNPASRPLPGLKRPIGDGRPATAALIAACTIWGTAFAFGKIALQELSVSQLVLLRFSLASLALLPALLRAASPRLQPGDLPRVLLVGLLAVPVTFLLQFHGLALTTVTRASLIIGSMPPLLALGSSIFLGEKPRRSVRAAIAGSVLGIALVAGTPGAGGSLVGDGLVLSSCLVSVAWVLMNKSLSEKYGALVATAALILAGTITLAPITIIQDGLPHVSLTLRTWGAVIFLGLFCTALSFALWNWGLERVPAAKAGIFLNLEPLVGAVLGAVVWREALTPGLALGGALVLLSSAIAAQADQQPPASSMNQGLGQAQPERASLPRRSHALRGASERQAPQASSEMPGSSVMVSAASWQRRFRRLDRPARPVTSEKNRKPARWRKLRASSRRMRTQDA